MIDLKAEQIFALAPNANKMYVESIVRNNHWFSVFDVNTPLRMAHFMVQSCHETAGFTRLAENLNYSAEGLRDTFGKYFPGDLEQAYHRQPERIANRVYANRMGNGPESSGDGWRYRGRGMLHATGRAMYAYLGYESNPDVLGAFPDALVTALRIWRDEKKCNALADRDDLEAVRMAINGGTNGLEDCKRLLSIAKRVFLKESVTTSRPVLKEGSESADVVELQRYLGVLQDGRFGPKTREALVMFQRQNGLLADGICGPVTWNTLTRVK